jgi:UDP-2,3-diacylglucosamine pyrophosphatase LpxH
MNTRILHISDLHIPFEDKSQARFHAINKRLLDILFLNTHKSVYQAKNPIDHLVVTGDLYNAKYSNITSRKAIVEILMAIMKSAGVIDKRNVHLVPGNHDLCHSKDEELKSILDNFDETNDENIQKLKTRFEPFWHLCREFYDDNNPWSKSSSAHSIVVDKSIAFIYVNSELLSIKTSSDDEFAASTVNSLVIDSTKMNYCQSKIVELIKSLDRKIKSVIFIAHHPPCNNEESLSELKNHITTSTVKRNYYWFCGHMHSDRIIPCNYMKVYQSGSLFGVNNTIPDFVIHTLSNEVELDRDNDIEHRSAFRFLNHLNNGDNDGSGGWKQVYLFPDSTTALGDTKTS